MVEIILELAGCMVPFFIEKFVLELELLLHSIESKHARLGRKRVLERGGRVIIERVFQVRC